MTKYEIIKTVNFKRDYKRIKKRGYDIQALKKVINKIANGEKLHSKHQDHALKGNYIGYRECHVNPDFLLVYKIENNTLC